MKPLRDLALALSSPVIRIWFLWLALAALSLVTLPASAHEVRPAYLSVQEQAPGDFSVLFKTPMQGNARLALSALFSGKADDVTPIVSHPTGERHGADLADAHC